MKIDYKRFNEFSKGTRQEIIDFSRMLLNSIELFDNGKNKICLEDFQKGDFDLQKIAGWRDRLNEIIDNKVTDISGFPLGWGPPNNRRLTVDITFEYLPETAQTLKTFLETVDKDKSTQITIHVDEEKGIYRDIKGAPMRYTGITSNSKIFQTISYLMQNKSATLADLARHTGQKTKVVKSSIERFNKNAIPRLGLPKGVCLIEGNGLYQLNSQVQFI